MYIFLVLCPSLCLSLLSPYNSFVTMPMFLSSNSLLIILPHILQKSRPNKLAVLVILKIRRSKPTSCRLEWKIHTGEAVGNTCEKHFTNFESYYYKSE